MKNFDYFVIFLTILLYTPIDFCACVCYNVIVKMRKDAYKRRKKTYAEETFHYSL